MSLRSGPVRSSLVARGPVPVGPIGPVGLVDPVLIGPVMVGPVLVGLVPVGPVPVGLVPVGPVPVGPVLVGPVPSAKCVDLRAPWGALVYKCNFIINHSLLHSTDPALPH